MKKLISLIATIWLAFTASAKVTLPAHFTSHMVLQQQRDLVVRGKATPGSTVKLTTSWKQQAEALADIDGRFTLTIATPKASLKPQTLTFSDGEETKLEDVLIGEVWLGSGQSNMEMPLEGWGKILNYKEEIAHADYPNIRLLQVKRITSLRPLEEVQLTQGGWVQCSPQTVPEFSSLCYFYAVRLWEELGIPVGVIDDSWGGTPCEAWIRQDALHDVMGFGELIDQWRKLKFDDTAIEKSLGLDEWEKRCATIDPGMKEGWQSETFDHSQWPTMKLPGAWELNGVSSFDGFMWFRRWVDIPEEWVGHDLTLELVTTDDMDITYWNGEKVGETHGYHEAANYVIPAHLVKAGRNVLAVRLYDTAGNGGLVSKSGMRVKLDDNHSLSLNGEWNYQKGAELSQLPRYPINIHDKKTPTGLYNAMIHPLVGFPLRGFIWYQGCDNVGRAAQHECLFQTLIQDWRQLWGKPDMPFYFVQLANYLPHYDLQPKSEWAALRETQARALCLPYTGMAVNIDLGVADDIHPKTKREVGRRLSAIALNQTYGKKIPYTAPRAMHYVIEDHTIHIFFGQEKGGETLVPEDNLPGFTVLASDGTWRVADAKVVGPLQVDVTMQGTGYPIAVRYGWADNPTCTLRTASGLHVAPFRSDR